MDESLSRKLAALRSAYARTLPQVATELDAAVAAWLAAPDGARAAEVRRLAHRLVGTSGSYGLPEVSASARALEVLTAADPSSDAVLAAQARLAAACAAAAAG